MQKLSMESLEGLPKSSNGLGSISEHNLIFFMCEFHLSCGGRQVFSNFRSMKRDAQQLL